MMVRGKKKKKKREAAPLLGTGASAGQLSSRAILRQGSLCAVDAQSEDWSRG